MTTIYNELTKLEKTECTYVLCIIYSMKLHSSINKKNVCKIIINFAHVFSYKKWKSYLLILKKKIGVMKDAYAIIHTIKQT